MKLEMQRHWVKHLQKGLGWFTKPSLHLTDVEDQRRARLLATILILHIVIYLLITDSHLDVFLPPPDIYPIVVILLGVFYIISRTRHYAIAALLYLTLNYSIIVYVTLTPPQDLEQTLMLLTLNVLLASLISPIGSTLIISMMSLLATLALSLTFIHTSMGTIIIFVSVSIAFIALSTYLRDRDTRYIHQQHSILAESEQRYQSLLHATREAIIIFQDGVIIDVNPAFTRIFGWDIDEAIGGSLLSYFDKTSHEILRDSWNSNKGDTIEVQGKRRDSSVFDAAIQIRPWVHNRENAFVLTAHDISERKKAERERAEQEIEYRALFEQNNHAIVIMDLDGYIIRANQQIERLLGYTPEELIGQHASIIIVEEDKDYAFQIWQRVLAGEELNPYERHYRHKDGHIIPVELAITLVRNPDGTPRHVQAIAHDVTYRKEAERARDQQAIQYRALFEQTSDAVFIINLDGTIARTNRQVTELLGYEPEEMAGKPAMAFVAPTELTKSAITYERVLAGERLPPYERIFLHKDGYEVPTEINVTIVRGTDGEPTHIQSIVRDIRGRKEAEHQQLQLAIERERVKVLQKFISDASHDFRTPLTNLKTSIFLLKALKDQQKRQHHLEVMDIQINRLERLLADMLVMSNLERHPTGYFQFGKVDMTILLREVIAAMQEAAKQRQVHLSLQNAEKLPPILADKLQIAQALRNIIENAVLYTEADGKIEISAQVKKGYIYIHIKDTGMGISEEDLPHIFESFYRADKARQSSTGGTGLGLPIAKKIITAHQGEIAVESQEGEGTRFTIMLPVANITAEQQND